MILKSSWDDCSKQDLRIANLMLKYEIPTIFYWPVFPFNVNEPNGRESLNAQDQENLSKLFEIGSHGINHHLLTRVDEPVAWSEIKNSRQMLQDKFNQDITSFCYPRGYANPDIQKMVDESGYTNARSTLVGYIHKSENPFFEQTTVHVGCNRKEYGGLSWLKYAFNMLEEAIKTPDSIFSIFGHGWELDKNNAWGDLETLLKAMV